MSGVHFKETQYGFEYGAAKVTRIHSDEVKKYVVIGIESSKRQIQVYITKTGKIRVFDHGKGEMQ